MQPPTSELQPGSCRQQPKGNCLGWEREMVLAEVQREAQDRKRSCSQDPPAGQLPCQAQLTHSSFCTQGSAENNLLSLASPCYSKLKVGKRRPKAVREPAPNTAVQARPAGAAG